MKAKFFVFFLLILVTSCKSTDMFLIKILDDSEKAKIVNDKGIASYKINIEQNQDINSINIVKPYFLKTLEYDKNNAVAKEYISKLANFKTEYLNKMLRNAAALRDKKDRKESDEYAIAYNIERVLTIDPGNKEALKMKRELKANYDKLIKLYLDKANESVKKADSIQDNNRKERVLLEAYDYYKKILVLDKVNSQAVKLKKTIENIFVEKVRTMLAEANSYLQKKQYAKADKLFDSIEYYNKKIDNKFIKEIKTVEYKVYYNWALSLYKTNKIDSSLYRVNQAIQAGRESEALDLRNKINSVLKDADLSKSFDSAIDDIDEMIANDDLVPAKNKIDSLSQVAQSNVQKSLLEKKLSTIMEKLTPIYNSAVADYNSENYKDASDKFGKIVNIAPDYKDAKSYYDKASEKQKILEKY
jgi:hypothetical protein